MEGSVIMVEPAGALLVRWRPLIQVAALALPLLTCALLSLVRDQVTAASSVLGLVVWVVAAAATGDRVAGVLAALSGAVWFDFFLTQPYLRFTIDDADDVETTVLLVLIGLAVSETALWGHRQQTEAARRSGYLDGVLTRDGRPSDVDRVGLPTNEYVAVPVQRGAHGGPLPGHCDQPRRLSLARAAPGGRPPGRPGSFDGSL